MGYGVFVETSNLLGLTGSVLPVKLLPLWTCDTGEVPFLYLQVIVTSIYVARCHNIASSLHIVKLLLYI